MCDLAHRPGCEVYLINPRDAQHYRQAVGTRAETDRSDAQLLARYVGREDGELRRYIPLTAQQQRVQTRLRRRMRLVESKGRIRQSLVF
jgi:transposase